MPGSLVRTAACIIAFGAMSASIAHAEPTGAHPRAFLRPDVIARWQALADVPSSPIARSIDRCDDATADPSLYEDGDYQGFRWVEALSACLVAFETTGAATHRDTAIAYFTALIEDRATVGDGLGPSYDATYGIVAQDSGYSMRTHGVFAALGYDWLHPYLSQTLRTNAHAQFVRWIAFHHDTDTYQRAQPGANYHAGHVLAITLLAIGHADEMNAITSGSGDALWDYVVDEMWGEVMADGHGDRGPLAGGDWLEGWQYAPLSVASYSLAGRAIVEQGVSVPWLGAWNASVLERFVHGLSPADRSFVGGDTQIDEPMLAFNPLPLHGVVAGHVASSVRREARGELARLGGGNATDFRMFYEALAAGEDDEATPIDRSSLPLGFFARGAGNYYGRTRHAPDAAWFVSQCKGIVVDHQHTNAGNVVISRGSDDLVVDPGPYGSLSTLTGNAPTMDQPHFNDEYRPSQGAFGDEWGGSPVPAAEATRMIFASATLSGVHATRCDYTGQFRFRDVPSPILDRAIRDLVVLPGESGATGLIVDRVATSSGYAADPAPLALRFHSPSAWTASSGTTSTVVGSSRLAVRRVVGDATNATSPVPVDGCDGDRGKCEAGRFASYRLAIDVDGPNPYAIHLLDADDAGASAPPFESHVDGSSRVVELHRETRRFVVVSSVDGTRTDAYEADDEPSTHVVLDPPEGARVVVTASPSSVGCAITLAGGTEGFATNPLVFTLDASCHPTEDTPEPPRVPPPAPETPNPRSSSGCGCNAATPADSPFAATLAFGAFVLLVRRRRSA